MEHLHHFGLRQDPYQNEPDLRFYFEGASHIAAHRRIERGLRQQKGLCILSGEGGTGKSLLTRRLLDSLEEEIFDAQLMLMMPGATDANSVLSRYARMMGVDEADSDRPTLLAQIYDQLAIVREEGRHCVLMLDDAHLLSKDALAEIGGLLNLEYEDRRLVSLLLVGMPQLDVTLSHEASLGQRIDVRTRLEAFDFQNTADYLKHRLTCAGGDAEILPEEAVAALFKFGRGRPRLLNTIADNALFECYLANRQQVNAHDVERAASELGIGANPGTTYSDMPQSQGHSGSSLPGAPGTTFELNEVAEPEFEASSFDTGAVAPAAAVDALQAMEMPGEGEVMDEGVDELLVAEPEPEAMAPLDGDSMAAEVPVMEEPALEPVLEAPLESALDAPLEPALDASLDASLDEPLGASLDASLDEPLGASLDVSLDAPLDSTLGGSLDASLEAPLDSSLDASLDTPLDAALEAEPLAGEEFGGSLDDFDSAVDEMMNASSGTEDEGPSPFDMTVDAANPAEPLSLEGEDPEPLETDPPGDADGEIDDLFVELIEE